MRDPAKFHPGRSERTEEKQRPKERKIRYVTTGHYSVILVYSSPCIRAVSPGQNDEGATVTNRGLFNMDYTIDHGTRVLSSDASACTVLQLGIEWKQSGCRERHFIEQKLCDS